MVVDELISLLESVLEKTDTLKKLMIFSLTSFVMYVTFVMTLIAVAMFLDRRDIINQLYLRQEKCDEQLPRENPEPATQREYEKDYHNDGALWYHNRGFAVVYE